MSDDLFRQDHPRGRGGGGGGGGGSHVSETKVVHRIVGDYGICPHCRLPFRFPIAGGRSKDSLSRSYSTRRERFQTERDECHFFRSPEWWACEAIVRDMNERLTVLGRYNKEEVAT